MTLVAIPQDRSLLVPRNHVVRTDYVSVWNVRLACRERMSVGDVDRAFQKRLNLGEFQAWPCPNGHWEEDTFVIIDGRHEYIAALMLGMEYILVAWIEEAGALTDLFATPSINDHVREFVALAEDFMCMKLVFPAHDPEMAWMKATLVGQARILMDLLAAHPDPDTPVARADQPLWRRAHAILSYFSQGGFW